MPINVMQLKKRLSLSLTHSLTLTFMPKKVSALLFPLFQTTQQANGDINLVIHPFIP